MQYVSVPVLFVRIKIYTVWALWFTCSQKHINVPDKDSSRNVSCTQHYISTSYWKVSGHVRGFNLVSFHDFNIWFWNVRFVFISSCLSCVICVCLRIVVSNTYCVVFLFFFVLNVIYIPTLWYLWFIILFCTIQCIISNLKH